MRLITPFVGGFATDDAACRGITGVEPHEISMLHFLMYMRASGGIKPLITIDNGHQERKFVLGAQTVSDRVRCWARQVGPDPYQAPEPCPSEL